LTEKMPISALPELDAAAWLDNDDAIADYLTLVLAEDDPALLAAALGDIARARARLAGGADPGAGSRASDPPFAATDCGAGPPFEAVSKACKAVGLRLVAQPVRDSALPRP
jgi:probable addiction module antidote protein